VLGLATFWITGFYVMSLLNATTDMAPAVRLTHRANHVYILFAALINLAAAGASRPAASRLRRILFGAGATLVVLSPLLTTIAFLVERSNVSPWRVWTMASIFATTFGVFGLAIGRAYGAAPPLDSPPADSDAQRDGEIHSATDESLRT